MPAIGERTWVIPEGYVPEGSHGPDPEMTSHETVCLLNAGDADVDVEITIYYEDRAPVGPYGLSVPAERTRHVRFNDLDDPEEIPTGTAFASVIEADRPVVCQHTRLDSRQAENALLSTMAFGSDG